MADYERRVDYSYGQDRLQSAPDLEECSAGRGGGSAQYSARDGEEVYSQQQQGEREGESDSIKVLVRIRPFVDTEGGIGKTDSNIDVLSETSMTVRSSDNKKSFQCSFDQILDMQCSQDDLYNYVRKGTASVLDGFNSTIFAYGQTGSGKTYSMYGPSNESNQSRTTVQDIRQLGVIPRAINDIFTHIEKYKSNRNDNSKILDCSVYCSFLQIYNENLYDMLRDVSLTQPLTIREDVTTKDMYVQGLSEYQVKSVQDTLQLLRFAEENRFVRETQMNQFSSRSHSIFQIWLEQKRISDVDGGEVMLKSKFNLVDLAGSEKWNINQYMGESHITEMTNINLSLHTLGRCIAGLAQKSQGKDGHIPYRESKLTRLLQDSLGGNSKTYLIATVSPANQNFEETISTLKFADRAKQVMVSAVINEHRPIDHAMVLRLQKEVEYLRNLVKQLQLGGISAVVKPDVSINIPRNKYSEDSDESRRAGAQVTSSSMFITEGGLMSPTSLPRLLAGGAGGAYLENPIKNLSQSQNFDFLGSLQSALTTEREAAIQLSKENQVLKNEIRLQQERLESQSQSAKSTIQPHQIKNIIDTVQAHHVKMWSNVDAIQKLMKKFSKFEIEEEELTSGIMKVISSFGDVRSDTTIFDRLNALMVLTQDADNFGSGSNMKLSPSKSVPTFIQQSGGTQKNLPALSNSNSNSNIYSNSNNNSINSQGVGVGAVKGSVHNGNSNNQNNAAVCDGPGLINSTSNSLFFAREERLSKQQEKYIQNLQQQLSISTSNDYSIGKEFKADLLGAAAVDNSLNKNSNYNKVSNTNNNNSSSNNSNSHGSTNQQVGVSSNRFSQQGRQIVGGSQQTSIDNSSNGNVSTNRRSDGNSSVKNGAQGGQLSPRPPPNSYQSQQYSVGFNNNNNNNNNDNNNNNNNNNNRSSINNINAQNTNDLMDSLDAGLAGLQNIQQNIQNINPKSNSQMPAVSYRVRGGVPAGNGNSSAKGGVNNSNNNVQGASNIGSNANVNNGNVLVSADGWVSMKDDNETDEEKLKRELKKQQQKLKKQQQMQEWLQSKEERMMESKRAEDDERQTMLEAEQNREVKRQEYAKKSKKKIADYQQKIKEEAEQIKNLVDLGIDPNSLF